MWSFSGSKNNTNKNVSLVQMILTEIFWNFHYLYHSFLMDLLFNIFLTVTFGYCVNKKISNPLYFGEIGHKMYKLKFVFSPFFFCYWEVIITVYNSIWNLFVLLLALMQLRINIRLTRFLKNVYILHTHGS